MEYISLIERLREAKWFMRITAVSQIFFFLFVFYSPSAHAAVEGIKKNTAVSQIKGRSNEEKLTNSLQSIKDSTTKIKAAVDLRVKEDGGISEVVLNFLGLSKLQNESLDALVNLNEQVQSLNSKVIAGFANVETKLKVKKLPKNILKRHYSAVNKYKANYAKLQMYIQNCVTANSLLDQQAAIDELDGFLQQQKFKPKQSPFDPDNMPFSTPNPKDTRAPISDSQQLSQLINEDSETQLAEKILDTFISSAYAAGATANDLTETIDIQFTDAIRQKAQELNNNPLEIYNWVRNTIEFVPTYGSIQGAEYTLQTLSGNSFDTASLLIALLRAADVPARYAYGTVRIPVEQVMNWVGGVEVPEAAQQLLGQGGIPNIAQVNAGKITHIKMEHIWVEAWVDFEPSRGVKNLQGDSWVPMDGSFKQFNYTSGIDVEQIVTFDAEFFANKLESTATINEQEGFVANLDSAYIQTTFNDLQTQLNNHINISLPGATAEDLIGRKTIVPLDFQVLPSSLPYTIVNISNRISALPDNLRHKVAFEVAAESYFGVGMSFTASLPELVNKRVTLSYIPATVADQQTVDQYGSIYKTPAYLIKVKPQLKVAGEVKAEGEAIGMGTDQVFTMNFSVPGLSAGQVRNDITAGGYYAIGLFAGQLSLSDSEILQHRAQQLDNFVAGGGDRLSDHGLGEQLYLSAMGYFWQVDRQTEAVAAQENVVFAKLPGEGIFALALSVSTFFGIPRTVEVTGTQIDVDRVIVIASSKTGGTQAAVDFVGESGSLSSGSEHAIIEQLYGVDGISAIKAIQIANNLGLKIYNITDANLSSALQALQVSNTVKADIQNAINAGMEVQIPERELQVNQWAGVGYVISDPITGSAAYMISGGLNGGAGTQNQSMSDLFVDFVDFTSCYIKNVIPTIIGILSFIAKYKQALRFFVMAGIGAIALWIVVISLIIAYISAVIGCLAAVNVELKKMKRKFSFV